jgi:predicted aspartyl protease
MPGYRTPNWAGPPAPLADLTISWNGRSDVTLAILDTGADQTQIWIGMAQVLQLRKIRDKEITDANGQRVLQPVYVANLGFDGIVIGNLPVLATALRIALIGRDVLNQVAVLDGPQLTYSVVVV